MKELIFHFLKSFRNNLLLKILAVLIAVVSWTYIMVQENPAREKIVTHVGVQIENVSLLQDKKFVLADNINELLSDANISISVKQQEFLLVNSENVTALIDLSQVNQVGEVELKVSAVTTYGSVVSVTPSKIKVTIEDYVSKTVPVRLIQTGKKNTNYYYSDPNIMPSSVTVSGARSKVESVSSAVANIDYTGIARSFNQSVNLTLQDSNSNELLSSDFSEIPSVILQFDVLPQKTVPINALSSMFGVNNLKTGYEFANLALSPDTITIAGDQSKLDLISEVVTDSFDISGEWEDKTFTVMLKPIDGIIFTDPGIIEATAKIRQIQTSKTFNNIPVVFKNIPSGLSTPNIKIKVTVSGGEIDIAKIKAADIIAYADLSNATAGINEAEVQFEPVDNISFSSNPAKIKVTLKR